MSMICQNCGKGRMKGHKVSHAKNRSIRFFKPNLHNKTVEINGKLVKKRLCARCIKKSKKSPSLRAPQGRGNLTQLASRSRTDLSHPLN